MCSNVACPVVGPSGITDGRPRIVISQKIEYIVIRVPMALNPETTTTPQSLREVETVLPSPQSGDELDSLGAMTGLLNKGRDQLAALEHAREKQEAALEEVQRVFLRLCEHRRRGD